jgi:hypothetical protein
MLVWRALKKLDTTVEKKSRTPPSGTGLRYSGRAGSSATK